MNSNGNQHFSQNQNKLKSEKTLQDFIQVIYRRKRTLLIAPVSTLIFVFLYNFIASPVYEASVTLKKEIVNTKGQTNQFKEMFSLQTQDELSTEIESINTRTVIEDIIKELQLLTQIKKIEYADGSTQEINKSFFNYSRSHSNNNTVNFPQILSLSIDANNPSVSIPYYIKIKKPHTYLLYEEETDYLLQTIESDSQAAFNTKGLQFEFNWPGSKSEDKFFFAIKNLEATVKSLQNNITISKVGATNIFKVSFQSNSPETAQLVANTIVEKYRDNRLKQKRQTIHYSFEFVDNQLTEISEKLTNAEIELNEFKSNNKITSITQSANEIISFLSDLESEKIETELKLADYRNRTREIEKEKAKSGYVDQTYLAPEGSGSLRSPFSILLGKLSDAEIERLDLLQRRRESHPDVIALDNQISQIKTTLAEYNQNTITSYKIISNTLVKKQQNLNTLIKKYSAQLQKLPAQETTLLELTRQKNTFEKIFTVLTSKREELRMAELSELQDIVILDEARLPFSSVSPKKTVNIILGLFLGLILGAITVFVQEFLEDKVVSIDEIEKKYSAPILAIIPKYDKEDEEFIEHANDFKDRLVNLMDNHLQYLESYRLLRTRLLNFSKQGKKVFIITSCDPNTGKSTTVANLAVSLARTGKKVLVIDGDLKMAGLSRIFSIPKDFYSIENYLSDKSAIPILFKPFKNGKSKFEISILSAGNGNLENSSELFELEKMNDLLEYAKNKFDYVLIDSPPINRLVDTLILSRYVNDFIFIIRPNHTFKEGLNFAFEIMEEYAINVNGFVINAYDVDKSSPMYQYGYKYGSGYDPITEQKKNGPPISDS